MPEVAAAAILDALATCPSAAAAGQYRIAASVNGGFVGKASDGSPTLLLPMRPGRLPLGRSLGGLELSYGAAVTFETNGPASTAPAAILRCTTPDLTRTFAVLAADIAARAGTLPGAREITIALAEWERLLRVRHRLDPSEELGLWGELWFIHSRADVDSAIRAWQGPGNAPIDFFGGGIGVECKTTRTRLKHFVSQSQVARPLGDTPVFLLSVWTREDDLGGSTLNDLIADITSRATETLVFEERLLEVGYSRADAILYRQRFQVLEDPLLFSAAVVPRIRTFDEGISEIRFAVTLSEDTAVSTGQRQQLPDWIRAAPD